MRRYLVVAHKTLGGEHLFERLHDLRVEHPECRFHVVVPMQPPPDHVWTEQEVNTAAAERLDTMLETMAEMGMGASGEVGDANPVYAIGVVMRRDGVESVSGIVLSTLPRGISRWWRFDVPRRVAQAYPSVPLIHVVAEDALVG